MVSLQPLQFWKLKNKMIIKGLFRKYEKWNPVHPTSGAFWGMGLGVGCGVGWGPGFGPQVVGYVGSGCGIGFSVGITFAGLGIGLPAKLLPYKGLHLSQRCLSQCFLTLIWFILFLITVDIRRDDALNAVLFNARGLAINGWNNMSMLQREATSRFQNTVASLNIDQQLRRFRFPSFGSQKGTLIFLLCLFVEYRYMIITSDWMLSIECCSLIQGSNTVVDIWNC